MVYGTPSVRVWVGLACACGGASQLWILWKSGPGIVRRRSQPVCQPELLIVHAALDPIMARPALWIFTTVGYGRRHDHRMSPLVITRLDVTFGDMSPLVTTRLGV